MAYAPHRSMNAALSEGMTDGKYKKVVRDRGGFVDVATEDSRRDLDDIWFGIHEKQVKMAPDNLLHATPQFEQNAAVNRDLD